jgi:hypothetical protein
MRAYQVETLMNEGTLAAASTVPSTVAGTECAVANLTDNEEFALTVECLFATAATGNAVVHVKSSPSGGSTSADEWDTEDYVTATLSVVAATRVQKTIVIEAAPKFAKVLVENEDATKALYDIVVTKVTTP